MDSTDGYTYEDGDLRRGPRGGYVNVYACRFFLSDPMPINSTGIESRGIGLFKMPKIFVQLLLSSENESFTFSDIDILMDFLYIP